MSCPLVIAVVLNTNHRSDTLECLASLDKSDYPNQRAILLDNASTDGTVEAVRLKLPKVQIIELSKDLGYAGNNNVGINAATAQGADWVFVLNEDTWQAPDCISNLIAAGESNPSVGIIGPMVYHGSEPNVIQSAGGRLDRYYREWHLGRDEADQGQFSQPHGVEWVSGCGILVRRELIEQVGTIDERFYYYAEELEWCVRARQAGWKVVHVPAAKLWHKGVTRGHQPKPSVTYYATRNRLLLLFKHHASPLAWIINGGQLLRTLTSWTIKSKWRTQREHRKAMWRGMVDFVHQQWGRMS